MRNLNVSGKTLTRKCSKRPRCRGIRVRKEMTFSDIVRLGTNRAVFPFCQALRPIGPQELVETIVFQQFPHRERRHTVHMDIAFHRKLRQHSLVGNVVLHLRGIRDSIRRVLQQYRLNVFRVGERKDTTIVCRRCRCIDNYALIRLIHVQQQRLLHTSQGREGEGSRKSMECNPRKERVPLLDELAVRHDRDIRVVRVLGLLCDRAEGSSRSEDDIFTLNAHGHRLLTRRRRDRAPRVDVAHIHCSEENQGFCVHKQLQRILGQTSRVTAIVLQPSRID